MRMGKKKQPMYRVVVIDGRAPRDGRYIEQIGRYEPLHDPSIVEIDNERAASWLAKGAQPSETVSKLLDVSGAMDAVKLKTGAIHVVGSLPSDDEPEADEPEADDSETTSSDKATVESPAGEDTETPAGETDESPAGETDESPAGETDETPAGEDTETPAGETDESAAGESEEE